jgi:hypothetical protein
MFNFNVFDMGPALEAEGILVDLGGKAVSEDDIIDYAFIERGLGRPFNAANAYTYLTYDRLTGAIYRAFPVLQGADFELWVNCADSKFRINGNLICSLDDIKAVIAELEETE